MLMFNPTFITVVIILAVLAVSTKDSENVSIKSPISESSNNDHDEKFEEYRSQTVKHEKESYKNEKSHNEFNRDAIKESFYKNVTLMEQRAGYGRGVKSQTALSALNVGNLAVLGIVVLGGMALVSPLLFPEFKRSMERSISPEDRQGLSNFITSRLVGVSESIMGWVEKSVDDLPSFPRLDAQECMKRCICEAHNQPKKYGMIGLILQLFFPPYTETEEPSKVVSKYQLAARYGRQDNANCAAHYDGCMVNFLDLVQGLINLIL